MKKSIETRTYKSAGDHNVSQIKTTNDYLILYLIDKDDSKCTVIDINVKDRTILVKKEVKWKVIAEKLGNLRYKRDLYRTEEEWCEDVAEKL